MRMRSDRWMRGVMVGAEIREVGFGEREVAKNIRLPVRIVLRTCLEMLRWRGERQRVRSSV